MDLTGSCFIFSAYVSVLTSLSAVSILTSVPFSSLSRESRFLSRDLERFLSRDRDRRDRFDFFDRDELRSLLDRSRLLLKRTVRDCANRLRSTTVNFAVKAQFTKRDLRTAYLRFRLLDRFLLRLLFLDLLLFDLFSFSFSFRSRRFSSKAACSAGSELKNYPQIRIKS